MSAAELDEGDRAVLAVTVARSNDEQALVEFQSTDGWFSIRVPLSELLPAAEVERLQAQVDLTGQEWAVRELREDGSLGGIRRHETLEGCRTTVEYVGGAIFSRRVTAWTEVDA